MLMGIASQCYIVSMPDVVGVDTEEILALIGPLVDPTSR
jgi:hypothetical protein